MSAPSWLAGAMVRIAGDLARLRRALIPARWNALELATQSWVSHALAAFCALGLADALAAGPRTPQQLAREGYGDGEHLFRLLRSLCAYGVVRPDRNGSFALTRVGRALTGPDSVAPMVRYANTEWHMGAYSSLAKTVREGGCAFERRYGMPLFDYFERDRDGGASFDAAMQSLTALFAPAFAAAYDFAGMRHVVDVGGGTGLLLRTVLRGAPFLRGTVFELPRLAAQIRTGDRLDALAGNILVDRPPAADAYIFSHVLHDWNDAACVRMLTNAAQAMAGGSRVLIFELIAPPAGTAWSQDRLTDLEMMAMLGGKERTRKEFEALLEAGGLQMTRIIRTAVPESILEARLR